MECRSTADSPGYGVPDLEEEERARAGMRTSHETEETEAEESIEQGIIQNAVLDHEVTVAEDTWADQGSPVMSAEERSAEQQRMIDLVASTDVPSPVAAAVTEVAQVGTRNLMPSMSHGQLRPVTPKTTRRPWRLKE